MSKFLMIMGVIHLITIILAIICLGLFFIIDFYQEKKKKKSNIEILIEEEINKDWSEN